MSRSILGLRPHVEDDHVPAREPPLELRGTQLLDPVPLAEVLVREHAHLGYVPDSDVADSRPQVANPLARQTVEDPRPLATRAHQTRPCKYLKMLRRVRDALRDLAERREHVAASSGTCTGGSGALASRGDEDLLPSVERAG